MLIILLNVLEIIGTVQPILHMIISCYYADRQNSNNALNTESNNLMQAAVKSHHQAEMVKGMHAVSFCHCLCSSPKQRLSWGLKGQIH